MHMIVTYIEIYLYYSVNFAASVFLHLITIKRAVLHAVADVFDENKKSSSNNLTCYQGGPPDCTVFFDFHLQTVFEDYTCKQLSHPDRYLIF